MAIRELEGGADDKATELEAELEKAREEVQRLKGEGKGLKAAVKDGKQAEALLLQKLRVTEERLQAELSAGSSRAAAVADGANEAEVRAQELATQLKAAQEQVRQAATDRAHYTCMRVQIGCMLACIRLCACTLVCMCGSACVWQCVAVFVCEREGERAELSVENWPSCCLGTDYNTASSPDQNARLITVPWWCACRRWA
jgi:hypothetical protein